MDEKEFIEQYAPWYLKMKYHPIFTVPSELWRVDASWRDAYFRSAKKIVLGVVNGELMPAIHGVAGVFMFRHYLELAMKYVVFHARWLKHEKQNAENAEIQDLYKNHSLMAWWNSVKGETKGKLPQKEWDSLDTDFVEACVTEFESVDPDPGWRFRYHGSQFGVDKRPEHERVPVVNTLHTNFEALLAQMDHVHDVLNAIDVYLIETHGQNAEWEAEMNSW